MNPNGTSYRAAASRKWVRGGEPDAVPVISTRSFAEAFRALQRRKPEKYTSGFPTPRSRLIPQ